LTTLSRPLSAVLFPVLQESTIYFNSQPIAVVVAENLEQAEYAATLVRVVYDETKHVTNVEDEIARIRRLPITLDKLL